MTTAPGSEWVASHAPAPRSAAIGPSSNASARVRGATHLVVEEYVVRTLRPQLAPLLDAAAIGGERRVRLVFATRPAPGEGVAVFEVAR